MPLNHYDGGANRKAIVAQCEQSLRRLQTGYIDLYWMHCWDATTPIEETLRALDDLVRDGKVRYVGFSDTPAWKCAEAQTIARFRGFSPLIALQIEYSLLERTVEGELIPMARELGLGVTPWAPLKSGVLSGKYTRDKHGEHQPGRGAFAASALGEKTYDLIEEMARIAKEPGTTTSRVAISWVQGRPGVTSTIIGARTMEQLDDNLAALDVALSPEHLAKLEALSKPKLNFPADFIANGAAFFHGGTTINGRSAPVWPASLAGGGRGARTRRRPAYLRARSGFRSHALASLGDRHTHAFDEPFVTELLAEFIEFRGV